MPCSPFSRTIFVKLNSRTKRSSGLTTFTGGSVPIFKHFAPLPQFGGQNHTFHHFLELCSVAGRSTSCTSGRGTQGSVIAPWTGAYTSNTSGLNSTFSSLSSRLTTSKGCASDVVRNDML